MEHPAEDVLRRFLLASTTSEENCQVARHLLARCPSCADMLRKIRKEPPPPGAYNLALERLRRLDSALWSASDR